MGAEIAGDILAFLRTTSLSQIQGAAGLQNLRDDLNERAVDPLGRQRQGTGHTNSGGPVKRLGHRRAAACFDERAGQRADRRSRLADSRRRRLGDRPHHPARGDIDHSVGRAGPADHGHQLHALRGRAVLPAIGVGPAERAAQSRADQPVAVHDLLRHGPDLRPRLAERPEADDGQHHFRAGGLWQGHRAVSRIHAGAGSRQGSEPV